MPLTWIVHASEHAPLVDARDVHRNSINCHPGVAVASSYINVILVSTNTKNTTSNKKSKSNEKAKI